MQLCRFGEGRLGVMECGNVRDVTAALEVLPKCEYPFPSHDLLIAHMNRVIARIREIAPSSLCSPLAGVKLLSPVANPGKIIAAPVNYQKHLDEVKDDAAIHQENQSNTLTIHKAGLFLKANSSLVGPGEGIALRFPERRNDHEVELAVIISKRASNVKKEDALNYVAGYAIGLDISIRGTEDRSFRKSPDSYTVLGPCLVTPDEVGNPDVLDLTISVNGETRQSSNTRCMILKPAELIELASSFYTLYPGDIIITGTPEGVSPIIPGDTVIATVENVGKMEVKVRSF